jgi:hypothetical protein
MTFSTFEIWHLFTEGPVVDDREVLMERKGDPHTMSAKFFCLWMADGTGMAG